MTIAVAGLPYAATGQGPAEDVLCRYLELGEPGPVDNELQITTNDYVGEVEIDRRLEQILVTEEGSEPVACTGAAIPSVTNVDAISVRVARESLDSLILDLRNGFLAPGASAESDGTAEIEVSLEQAPGTVLAVIGTSAADHMELGSLGGGSYGANLNAAGEPLPDADVTARNAFVFLALGKGRDRVEALGRAAFATRAFNFSFAANGGRGDDVLVGNARRNSLWGGPGRDRLVGGGLGRPSCSGAAAATGSKRGIDIATWSIAGKGTTWHGPIVSIAVAAANRRGSRVRLDPCERRR